MIAALNTLGVGFGACHTEFVVHQGRARIIEVNYRTIGDHCDFLLADLLGIPIFERVLRVHLGEAAVPPAPPAGHATVDYVIARRAGTLTAAPDPVAFDSHGIRLTYRPLRRTGEIITLTHTNRDYVGAIRAIGPDARSVEAAVRDFRASRAWTIAP